MLEPQRPDRLSRPHGFTELGRWTDPALQERFRAGVSAILAEYDIAMRPNGRNPIIEEPEVFQSAQRPVAESNGRHALRVTFCHGQQRFFKPSANRFGLELICATTYITCQSIHVLYDGRERRWLVPHADRRGVREPRPRLVAPKTCADLDEALDTVRALVDRYLAEPERRAAS